MYAYETENFKYLRNNLLLNNSTSFSPKTQHKNTIFFPIGPIGPIEHMIDEKNIKNVGLIGVYKSASITFYSKTHGYLLCQEIRDNKLVYHPIGGKYETRDESIEYTACREFIEESGILKNNEFINLLSNYTSSNNNVVSYNRTFFNETEQKGIDFLYDILANDKITNYYDFYVNVDKEYIHKYYLINVDKCDKIFKNIIYNIDQFYHNTFNEIRNNDEYIIGLHWNKELTKAHLNKKNYSMLTIYLSNLLKSHKNNNF